ncbi:hypothetical protein TH66_12830 [Carbonactinospora thermoautotrophica]|uniref:Uncharacterized protein n=1 Tax=Carbonactinospora thermoautotrophica TaxID=1469144 RepID=A0A132N0M8_9ACTN|nr:hypothetical protein [Carbonactinospora thermoautotrophica]KWX02628.1 hypothetical protein LI90_3671 [Carbonactinospora thermoautotrophica]KWX03689.1 hypothetical protein TH66_12830 [Carbonactinospora thermoautotrophica]KWX06408.1 hypothetical protein TR74_22200 [Carbonactinospora thermoautotrophica]
MTIPPQQSPNGQVTHFPPAPPTLEEYLHGIRTGAQLQNPTLSDLMTYREWTNLLAGLVVSLLDTHPNIRSSVEAHARQWGWQG